MTRAVHANDDSRHLIHSPFPFSPPTLSQRQAWHESRPGQAAGTLVRDCVRVTGRSEPRSEAGTNGPRRGRVIEPVAYRYHALDVPGLGDDHAAARGCLRTAFQCHHSLVHHDGEPARIGEELLQDDMLADLSRDISIRAA